MLAMLVMLEEGAVILASRAALLTVHALSHRGA